MRQQLESLKKMCAHIALDNNYPESHFDTHAEILKINISDFCVNEEQKTLRDEFAMAALVGMVSAEYYSTVAPRKWSEEAYEIADEMLKERAKEVKV